MTRLVWAFGALVASSLVAVSAYVDTPTKLIWNASASTPIGLYAVQPIERLEVADLVAVDVPEPMASFLADGGYLPPGVPLLKRVVGLPGQQVCRVGVAITVNRVEIGQAREMDRLDRAMPDWQGCRRIAAGEVFLMNRDISDSLDGRYFGPLPASSIIGRAVPLWTDEDGQGRFEWRAQTR